MTNEQKDEIKELILTELKDLLEDEKESVMMFWSDDVKEFRQGILQRLENKLRKLNS